MRLSDYLEDLIGSEDLRPATLRSYGQAIRLYIGPELGERELEEITSAELRAFFGRLRRKGVGNGAQLTVYGVLSKAFKTAIVDEILDRNPLTSVKRPKSNSRRIDPPSAEEVAKIRAEAARHYRALISLLAWCGLRIGEAGGLTVDDWDPETRRLQIRRQMTAKGPADLKTTAAYRVVYVPQRVAAELDEHLKKFPPVEGRIFSTRDRHPVSAGVFYPAFQAACDRAGVRRYHPHQLRHHAVSAMARSGAPIKAVQTAIGHTTAELTLSVYNHVTEKDLQDIADRLENAS